MKREITKEDIDVTDISGEKKTIALVFENCIVRSVGEKGDVTEVSVSSLSDDCGTNKILHDSIAISEYKKEIVALKNKNRRLSESNSVLFISTMIFASMFIMALMKIWQVAE